MSRQAPGEVFDKRAERYDNLSWVHDQDLMSAIRHVVLPHIAGSNPRLTLDLATGTGAMLAQFQSGINTCVGLEPSIEMLSRARAGSPLGLLVRGCSEALPFSNQAFDFVICRNGLHHFANPDLALNELRRCSAPGRLACIIESVAPTSRSLPWWRETILLKDIGRNPLLCFTAPGLCDYLNARGLNIRSVALHGTEFDVRDWLVDGCVSSATQKAVYARFLNADAAVEEDMRIRRPHGKLLASKQSAIILAEVRQDA